MDVRSPRPAQPADDGRDELADAWDPSVWVEVPFRTSFARMARRDGGPADPDDPANARYRDGQLLYLARCDPRRRATLVVDDGA